MPNNSNNMKNKFPNQGNFSASQNNGNKDLFKNLTTNASANNQKNPANKAKQEIAKKGIEMAANAVAPGAGKIAKAAMNSKLGKQVLNKAGNAKGNPLGSLMGGGPAKGLGMLGGLTKGKKENSSEGSQENVETEGSTETQEVEQSQEVEAKGVMPKEVSKMLGPIGGLSAGGCLGGIIFFIIIASPMLGPIFFMSNVLSGISGAVKNVWNRIVWFVNGCENEQDCAQKFQEKFYKKVESVYEDYNKKLKVEINPELITATLTYMDPETCMEQDAEEGDEVDSEEENFVDGFCEIDYKQAKKKVDDLAKYMVSTKIQCLYERTTDDGVEQYIHHIPYNKNEYGEKIFAIDIYRSSPTNKCEEAIKVNDKTYLLRDRNLDTETVKAESYYFYYDEDRYREYLSDDFISEQYNVKDTEDIYKIVREIFLRMETVQDLSKYNDLSSSSSSAVNSTKVVVTTCQGILAVEELSLYEYLQGVIYAEAYSENVSEEYLKTQAVIAKNYLYSVNNATPDSMPAELRIGSCKTFQTYCSVTEGCHNMNDGVIDSFDSKDTIAPGSDNGEYYKPPLTDVNALSKISSAIEATLYDFVVSDGTFVYTNSFDENQVNQMIENGSTYKDIISELYGGEIKEISLGGMGYPLDVNFNRVTSAFGWRVHPTQNICKMHKGIDIASAGIDGANVYSIADGVVVQIGYDPSKSSGYGHYIIIGHGQNGQYEYYSLYAHLKYAPDVSTGDEVRIGQKIGNVGSTGASTGSHLHFEIFTLGSDGKTKIRQNPVGHLTGVQLTGELSPDFESETACDICISQKGVGNCK